MKTTALVCLALVGAAAACGGQGKPSPAPAPKLSAPTIRPLSDMATRPLVVLPARFVSDEDAERILDAWLATPFDGGRHARRIEKIELTPDANEASE